jgi:hypothetical protein
MTDNIEVILQEIEASRNKKTVVVFLMNSVEKALQQ